MKGYLQRFIPNSRLLALNSQLFITPINKLLSSDGAAHPEILKEFPGLANAVSGFVSYQGDTILVLIGP